MAKFGIDLGTTFSCIAKFDEEFGKVELVSNSAAKNTTPSVVYIKDGEEAIVGDSAINQLKGQNAASVVSFAKRLIADDKLFEKWSFPNYPTFQGMKLTPIEISAMILKELTLKNVNIQNMSRGEDIEVVITYPAYFTLAAKERTKQAGELAGLKVIAMIEEPVAAALSYGMGEQIKNETVMVYDLGGGTFDVTVVKFDANGNGKVLVKEGNPALGGVDWDNEFGYYIWQRYCEKEPQKITLTLDDFKQPEKLELAKLRKVNSFRMFAQTAKHELTDMTSTDIECDNEGTIVSVSREDFDRETAGLLTKTLGMINTVLKQVQEPITAVLLVGGSSFMPQVKEGLEKAFPQFTGKIRLQDPHLAVAKGAAIYAAKAQMSDVDYGYSTPVGTIINTASMSYGIDAVDLDRNGKIIDTYVAILITKGMQLPATGSSTFYTIGPTNKMKLQVFEYKQEAADRVRIEQATKLGKESGIIFERQVPKDTPVEVIFHLSDDGLLTVTANSKVDSGHVEFTLDINGTMTTGQKAISKDLLRKV